MGVKVETYNIALTIDYEPVLAEFGKIAVEEVRSRAPVRSGTYKNDIAWTVKSVKGKDSRLIVYVRPPQYRLAHILEFGTSGLRAQRAQPHFRPAFDKLQKDFVKRMKEVDINET